MNNKNTYAYVLLGAVILAGVAGYMMSDSADSSEVILTDANDVQITVTVKGPSADSVTTSLEDSNGESS